MKRLILAGLWVVAIVSLSQLFEAGRTFDDSFGAWFVLETLLWLALLGGSLFVLTLRMYAIERKRGNVVRPVGVFERLLAGGEDGAS